MKISLFSDLHTVCYTPALPLRYFQDSRNFEVTLSHRNTPKRNTWRKCLQKNGSVSKRDYRRDYPDSVMRQLSIKYPLFL